jgi:signal peptidase I
VQPGPPEQSPESAAPPWAPVAGAPWAPIPGAPRGSHRWVLWILVSFAVIFGGCGAFLGVNTRARETIIAVSKGANHSYYAASDAMAPAMPAGARFMTKSNFGTVRRGDVVTFTAPGPAGIAVPSNQLVVKRVVGLPGELIDVRDGDVIINGAPLVESYLAPGTRTECQAGTCRVSIPDDSYFVMGDKRSNSRDSRFFGVISRASIRGVVIRIVSPPSVAGAVPGSSR